MIYTNKLNSIITTSTSDKTAKTTTIVLRKTERIRTTFEANLIKNDKNSGNCVEGKLIHEKKRKNELNFPTEIISKKDLKIGDALMIHLDTTETKKLFDGLRDRYNLFSNSKIHSGTTHFVKIEDNETSKILLTKISELKLSEKLSNYQIMNAIEHLVEFLKNKDNLKNQNELNENSKKISNIQANVNLFRLKTIRNNFSQFMTQRKNEEEWQTFFKDNQWLLSLLFHAPTTVYQDKAYVGGKKIKNEGGNIVDFLCSNEITKNATLIEIKTPNTKLLNNSKYRANSYSISEDLSGGVNQILYYKHSLLVEYKTICEKDKLKVFNPLCLLIIGKRDELESDESKMNTFDLFRNSLNGLTIITFDEMLKKLDNLISLLEK